MPSSQRFARISAVALASAWLTLPGCVTSEGAGQYYTDWDRAGACASGDDKPWGASLAGKPLGPCSFGGNLVWISYDALWCGPCRAQTAATSEAARQAPDHTVFMWVLSGGSKMFTPASEPELRRWAEQFALDPAFVVSEGATARTLPQHALIGPDGRTWFRYVGLMNAAQILDTIRDFRLGKRQPAELQ